jgi:hypothetical protein
MTPDLSLPWDITVIAAAVIAIILVVREILADDRQHSRAETGQ